MARLLVIAIAFLFMTSCEEVIESALVPDETFDADQAPPAPDYSDESSWAALPGRDDNADVTPAGETDHQADAEVDVFFIHPTTYYRSRSWNQPLDAETANRLTDDGVLRNQASVFNDVAKIYAPRYRQATLGTFVTDRREEGQGAVELAYSDVERAFDYYLEHYNDGRPFIIASHSQGSYHTARLLAQRVSGTPLLDRLVAAYPIGAPLADDLMTRLLKDIPICSEPSQTRCLVTWNTVGENASRDRLFGPSMVWYPTGYESNEGKHLICVNPVTWRYDTEESPLEAHLGAVRFRDDDEHPRPERQHVRARCDAGLLVVDLDRDSPYWKLGENYHGIDYSLFYVDVRRNAKVRVSAFLTAEQY